MSEVAQFYDDFSNYQVQSSLNDRIFNLYKRLRQIGVSKDSKLLEIGCGIGILTSLLSKVITKGVIESIDISPKSIEIAKKRVTKKNVHFVASSIFDFKPNNQTFQVITLFDVIEHISLEKHEELFRKIQSWMNDDSHLLINIPNPNHTLYYQKISPERLQVIDQPIFTDVLISNLSKAGLEIISFETYDVWEIEDYRFLKIRKKNDFSSIKISEERSLFEKIIYRINQKVRGLIYR